MYGDWMQLQSSIQSLVVFTFPGLLANYIHLSINSHPKKRDEWIAKLQFITFSAIVWGSFYLMMVLSEALADYFYHVTPYYRYYGLNAIPKLYGLGMIFIAAALSIWWGVVAGLLDVKGVHERMFNPIRKELGQKPEWKDDLWTRKIVPLHMPLFNVSFSDGRVIWGLGISASSRDEERALFLNDKTKQFNIDIINCLPPPDGVYVDLTAGYTLTIYDGRKAAYAIQKYFEKQSKVSEQVSKLKLYSENDTTSKKERKTEQQSKLSYI